ncbi:MAG: (Fe-S)-binding protein [Bacteroidales bacterium]
MALPEKEVIGILSDNLKIRNSVLPISKKSATRWAKDLNISPGGETVLYTGMMYQIIPYITALVNALEKMEGSFLMKFITLGRYTNRFINISNFFGKVDKKEIKKHNHTLKTIARLLQKSGTEFGYLYDNDLYVGALAYDLGADDVLNKHIRKVHEKLKANNVKKVITVDPHTTNMLRDIIPQRIEGFDIEVKSYMEVLAEKGIQPVNQLEDEVVIHDSCIYARHEGMVDEPRSLLNNAGIKTTCPEDDCGKFTFCCGGPVESLYPDKAMDIGKQRLEQLHKAGNKIAVMCPVCYANLTRSNSNGLQIHDIVDLLEATYL